MRLIQAVSTYECSVVRDQFVTNSSFGLMRYRWEFIEMAHVGTSLTTLGMRDGGSFGRLTLKKYFK